MRSCCVATVWRTSPSIAPGSGDIEVAMNSLAMRSADFLTGAVDYSADGWMPDEAPLAMPRQAIDQAPTETSPVPLTSPIAVANRRRILFGATFLLAGLAAITPLILYARGGYDVLEVLALVFFIPLVLAVSCWFCNAAAGLVVMMTNREQDDLDFSPWPPTPFSRTALLMPLYNEDPAATLARLSAIDVSLARLGVSGDFDLFVLSDSTKAEAIAAEHSSFSMFRLRAHSRAFYRRRDKNTEAKAGNIADWTRRFGGAYDFMIVLDADSTMAGETVLRLVDAMERNPGVGLIQTAPTIVNASTLFARVSQFSVRLYGRVAAAGLAWWTGSEGSYWGHNAILRVKAFADSAGLPVLPGRKPFGGHVMSHDVVEAALLRRAGWAVHVTAALDGSSEETPPTITDFIRREHRWCQGNLQHLGMVGSRGLGGMSRLQLVMGAMAYLSSPLWFAFMAVGMLIQLQYPVDWDSFLYFLHPELSPFMLASLLSGVLLIGPKIMGAVLVLSRPRERRAFGGGRQVVKGMAAEILLSAALAPIFMVANTKAVIKILAGHDAGWHAQQREADGISWADAFRTMRWQMATGLVFVAGLIARPDLTAFFIPIVLPLLLAAPIAVWTSRRASGEAMARAGYLVTPSDDGSSATPAVLHATPRPSQDAAWGETTAARRSA